MQLRPFHTDGLVDAVGQMCGVVVEAAADWVSGADHEALGVEEVGVELVAVGGGHEPLLLVLDHGLVVAGVVGHGHHHASPEVL